MDFYSTQTDSVSWTFAIAVLGLAFLLCVIQFVRDFFIAEKHKLLQTILDRHSKHSKETESLKHLVSILLGDQSSEVSILRGKVEGLQTELGYLRGVLGNLSSKLGEISKNQASQIGCFQIQLTNHQRYLEQLKETLEDLDSAQEKNHDEQKKAILKVSKKQHQIASTFVNNSKQLGDNQKKLTNQLLSKVSDQQSTSTSQYGELVDMMSSLQTDMAALKVNDVAPSKHICSVLAHSLRKLQDIRETERVILDCVSSLRGIVTKKQAHSESTAMKSDGNSTLLTHTKEKSVLPEQTRTTDTPPQQTKKDTPPQQTKKDTSTQKTPNSQTTGSSSKKETKKKTKASSTAGNVSSIKPPETGGNFLSRDLDLVLVNCVDSVKAQTSFYTTETTIE